jgi:polyisoprenoid-binding protein YceI
MKAFVPLACVLLAACSPEKPASTTSTGGGAANTATTAAATAAADLATVPAGSYQLDPSHATLLFRINHMGFSNYTARFKRFTAELEFDPKNLAASKVVATVDATSIETDFPFTEDLDFNAELQGKDWLNAAEFPEITFQSTQVEVTAPTSLRITGDLNFRGVTRPVTLDATFNGGYPGMSMDPKARIGFSARGNLNRSEFGMTYGIPPAGSRMGVSDAVEMIIEAEFQGPPWQQPAEGA